MTDNFCYHVIRQTSITGESWASIVIRETDAGINSRPRPSRGIRLSSLRLTPRKGFDCHPKTHARTGFNRCLHDLCGLRLCLWKRRTSCGLQSLSTNLTRASTPLVKRVEQISFHHPCGSIALTCVYPVLRTYSQNPCPFNFRLVNSRIFHSDLPHMFTDLRMVLLLLDPRRLYPRPPRAYFEAHGLDLFNPCKPPPDTHRLNLF